MISENSSTNVKFEMISEFIKDESFKNVIEYGLNPEKIYGIRVNSKHITENLNGRDFHPGTFDLLDKLIARQLTGNAARQAIQEELDSLNPKSADLLVRIMSKDFRAGFSEKIVNKACKGLIVEYPYMRCSTLKNSKINEFNYKEGIFSELKLDGLFANGNCLEELQFSTRNGSPFIMDKFKTISDELSHITDEQLHGELLVEQDGVILERKIGNGILNSVMQGGDFESNQKPIYVVWDIIPIKEAKQKNVYKVPYKERFARLEKLIENCKDVRLVEYKICYSYKEVLAHAMELIRRGEEGTVAKDPNMFWEGRTSKYQVKIKVEFDIDLEIKEILPGNIDTKYEGRPGTLSLESSDGLLKVNVVIKNEKMRDLIEENPDDWISKIVVVRANELMESTQVDGEYSLFLPRLADDMYRSDKTEADDIQRIKDIIESVINPSE